MSGLVPQKNWDDLKSACDKRDKNECKELLKENLFLRYYSESENLKKRNIEEAKNYLKKLKAGAFFTGMLPGVDIGMEYLYKNLFKEKLKSLYGFDYDKAINVLKKNNIVSDENEDKNKNNSLIINDTTDDDSINEENDNINDVNNNKKEKKSKKEENVIKIGDKSEETDNLIDREDNSINDTDNSTKTKKTKKTKKSKKEKKEKKESDENEIKNTGKNAGSIIRGIAEVGGIVVKALPEAGVEAGAVVA